MGVQLYVKKYLDEIIMKSIIEKTFNEDFIETHDGKFKLRKNNIFLCVIAEGT